MHLNDLFGTAKPVIGMVHLQPLPGAPLYEPQDGLIEAVRESALADAKALAEGGVHGLIIENFGDAPFHPRRVPAHTVAFMTALAQDLGRAVRLPFGINVLRNDGPSALSVAAASGAAFIRVNVYVGARLGDQGILRGEAHRIQRLRKALGCEVRVFADLAVKHSAPLAPQAIGDEGADAVHRGLADALVVTGPATGAAADLDDARRTKAALGPAAEEIPVLVGSGAHPGNAQAIRSAADGVIVGTCLKRDGVVRAPVDPERVKSFLEAWTPLAP